MVRIPYWCTHTLYVTGFWKTDRNVTLSQLQFLVPTNSHTHTLSMHRCNTRLSCLVCFSRADFGDHVKPRRRQWRALDGRYGSDIHPCVSETSHRPSRLVKAYDKHFLDTYIATPNIPIGWCSHPPSPPHRPLQPTHPLYVQSMILQYF